MMIDKRKMEREREREREREYILRLVSRRAASTTKRTHDNIIYLDTIF